VLGETVFGEPRPVQPVAVEGPLHETGLHDCNETTDEDRG